MPSCRLHVEQEPQSPRPVMRKSTSWATLTRVLAGAGALALLFEASVRTVQPWRSHEQRGDLVQHLLGVELAVLQDADPQAVDAGERGRAERLALGRGGQRGVELHRTQLLFLPIAIGVLHDRAAAAAPRRNEARMAAGIAAAHGDQDVVGREAAMHEARLGERMRAVAVLRVVLAVAVLADALHALDRALGVAEQEVLRLLARPAGGGDDLHVLGRQDHHALAERDAAVVGHGVGDRAQDLLRRVAAVVLDIAEAAAGVGRDARRALGVALRLAEQRPRIAARALGDAEAVLARIALRRLVGDAGQHLEDVAQDQPHRPADRGVGAVAGAEQVDVGIHADLVGIGTAHDQQRRRAAGAGGRAVEVEVRPVHRLEGRDQHREILRQAAGHHGVDRGGMQRQVEAGRGMVAITVSGGRLSAASMALTRSTTGGTTGRPSVQPCS